MPHLLLTLCSEAQLQPKLDLSRINARGTDYRVAQGAHGQAGSAEDRVVRKIEKLRAELQVSALSDGENLLHRQVEIHNARADHGASPAGSETVRTHAWHETDSVRERILVEPKVRGGIGQDGAYARAAGNGC